MYLCELLLLYVTYIYLLCYFYSDDVEQSEMRERFSCYFERVLIEKMAIFEQFFAHVRYNWNILSKSFSSSLKWNEIEKQLFQKFKIILLR